jgi:hypothetical protein
MSNNLTTTTSGNKNNDNDVEKQNQNQTKKKTKNKWTINNDENDDNEETMRNRRERQATTTSYNKLLTRIIDLPVKISVLMRTPCKLSYYPQCSLIFFLFYCIFLFICLVYSLVFRWHIVVRDINGAGVVVADY